MLANFGLQTSVPMILGVSTLPLIVRTVVPSNGLLILVGKYRDAWTIKC